MAKAMAVLQGLGQKVSGKDHHDCRTLQVNMPSPKSVDIEFNNIIMTVTEGLTSKRKKTILKDVSGLFKSGHLTAIMGPSGAGKSSLMNALTGFSTKGVTGTIRAGDSICRFSNKSNSLQSLKEYRKKSCYILQDDRLNPLFTVNELMRFAADMKLGNTLAEKLKLTVINEVLITLGLAGTENTRCGNLSGGQRKRLSIAVELIDNPPVVFLDEPTTGLDSLTSGQCMKLLKNLARDGRTIVCTIHQPPASIYTMFDQITSCANSIANIMITSIVGAIIDLKGISNSATGVRLLQFGRIETVRGAAAALHFQLHGREVFRVYIISEGMCIYNESSENTVPYLASLGLHCPKYHNPADYVLEIATGEYGKLNELLAKECVKHLEEKEVPPAVVISTDRPSNGFSCGRMCIIVNPPHELYKFSILFKRCIIQQYRDWTVTHLKVLLHIVIGVLLGLLYEKAGSDASKTLSNLGFLLVSCAYLCYTSLMPAVLRFPSELSVLKKENFNNWYHLSTYYAAVLVTGMPIQIWFSFVYSAPSYFLSGQPLEFSRFAMFVIALANVTLLADAIGNVIGSSVNPINGTFFGAITTCAMIVFAGFLVLFSHMSRAMQFVSCMSFLKHVFGALVLALYSYDRQPLVCPDNIEYCHLRYPTEILNEFAVSEDNYWIDILILLIEIAVVRLIAYYTLRRKVRTST